MSNYAVQNNELENRFVTQWAARTPIDVMNIKFDPPNPQAPWCRFNIIGGDDRRQTSIGATTNNFRNSGVIIVQIFTPPDTGKAVAVQRADEAADIFNNWCGTNITCRASSVKIVGNVDSWFQVNAVIPFMRNELQ